MHLPTPPPAVAVKASTAELADFTQRQRPHAQARVLRMLGIPFTVHPIDGTLLVARAALARGMGDNAQAGAAPVTEPAVNLAALREHAKTTKSRRH